MNLRLPTFEDDYLNEITVCANFIEPQLTPDESVRFQSKYDFQEDAAWLRLLLDLEDGEPGHFHFDIGRDSVYVEQKSLKLVDISEVHKLVDRFAGLDVAMALSAEYSIPFDQLPERGMISTLLGVETESCGVNLSVDGASMSIEDNTFTKIRWYDNKKKERIEVKLEAHTESKIGDEYLENAVELMQIGLECFFFETSEDLSYDTETDATKAKA